MDTDHPLFELFQRHPEWLAKLTGLIFPPLRGAASMSLKQIERRVDLVLEPVSRKEPLFLVDFQLYFDHSIFHRVWLSCEILWSQCNSREDCRLRGYRPRETRGIIIFGDRDDLPEPVPEYPGIQYFFLDELLESLARTDPESPIVSVLSPLYAPASLLEKDAAKVYHRLQNDSIGDKEDRELLVEIYLNLLLQRFKTKSRKEIQAMIAELTPLKETRAGAEIYEEGKGEGWQKGLQKGRGEGKDEATRLHVIGMAEVGMSVAKISRATGLPEDKVEELLAQT